MEGIRPFDGKSYSHMIEQLKDLLQSPDIGDGDSEPRRRLEELMRVFRPLYALKARRRQQLFCGNACSSPWC